MKKNILICQPNMYNDDFYLPYVWAVLKSYSESYDRIVVNSFNWLAPIYKQDTCEQLMAEYDNIKIDILGLSCYVWNTALNLKIAKYVKKKYPECIIIAGGPNVNPKNGDFFIRNPEVNLVIKGEGEIAMSKILVNIAHCNNDFSSIPGLIIPKSEGGMMDTGLTELPPMLEISPYIQEKEYFEAFIKQHNITRLHWETNRGCPYKCAYCDWGSGTNKKVRYIPIERLFNELEWFAKNKTNFLFVIDANFGINQRDLDIVDKLKEVKANTNFPDTVSFQPAKNNVQRIAQIAVRLYESKLISYYSMAIQHVDKDVLTAINRVDLSIDEQKLLVKILRKNNVPSVIQIILGLPGDSFQKWKTNLTELMEFGLHEEYRTNLFNLLPGSPAYEEDYKNKWGIETVTRNTISWNGRDVNENYDELYKSEYVVKTNTFSKKEWVNMYMYNLMVLVFHNSALTRFVAIYMRFTHNISYLNFYDNFYEDFFMKNLFLNNILDKYKKHINNFIFGNNQNVSEEMIIRDICEKPIKLLPEEYLVYELMNNYELLQKEMYSYFKNEYKYISNLESILHYQKNIIITPDYDFRKGKYFTLAHDWIEYFKTAGSRLSDEGALEEPPKCIISLKAKDMGCGSRNQYILDWVYQENASKVNNRFIDQVIGVPYSRVYRTYFRNLKFSKIVLE